MKFLAIAVVLGFLTAGVRGKVDYDGYRVFRVATHHDASAVQDQIESFTTVLLNLDTSKHLDVAVAPEDVAAFEALDLETEVLHEDLGADITGESAVTFNIDFSAAALPDLSWFNAYHPYADHVQFFTSLQANFPNNSELVTAGTSYQGRSIFGIHLWGSGGNGSKPAIYFHGTVHAREWITAMVVEYLTYQLIDGYGKDAAVKALVDKFDFYILPFVNPDGFVYSQTDDRLWRKTRQPRSGTSCVGTDVNRNWPYRWDVPGGASTNPCSETYKGAAAGDTPENRALAAFTQQLAAKPQGIRLYVDWHSYGQYILLPYGYDCAARAANHAAQLALAADTAAEVAARYGTRFTYGPSCSTLYTTTGDSVDYLTDVAAAEYAWTIELRPTGGGSGGFVLPPAQILPSALEQWDGMKYLLAQI